MSGRETILVVEDNHDTVTILRSILEAKGFEIFVAYQGMEALHHLEERQPDLILLDIMMPEMSGMEVLQRIKENPQTARIPVILLTAKSQDEDIFSGYQSGADYYITKPFTSQQLLYGINLVLGREKD